MRKLPLTAAEGLLELVIGATMDTPRRLTNDGVHSDTPTMLPRLITIPFSHYCEKARWALDRRGVAFVEEAHLPVLHTRATRAVGGRSTPLLVIDDGGQQRSLTDSTDILRYADAAGTRGERLFPPADSVVGGEVAALEDRFDEFLGPHARRLAYFFLLDDGPAMRQLLKRAAVPAFERALALSALPLVKLMLRRGLKISADGAARSRVRLEELFADVDARLADGRRFLVGDRFTAADLSFAALASPLVMPPACERYLLPLTAFGEPFRRSVDQWRATRAGAFAMAMFDSERTATP